PAGKVVTSGMPVRLPADFRGDRRASLTHLGLASDVTTVLLTAGKEGACDYAAVVESISRNCTRPLQIVAVCGNNSKQRALLTALRGRLPSPVMLKALGRLPHPEMMSYMRVADLLISKAGGMTPTEAFAMGTPTILLDAVGGHERENAAMFVRLGMAELATDTAQMGKIVEGVLADTRRMEEMLSAQREFRQDTNIAKIAEFALDESFVPARPIPGLGVENGPGALNSEDALARLNDEAPADVELLLSYANSSLPRRFVRENPFGHLAIRIGDTVYSVNYIAVREIDPNLLQHLSLGEYLYGVRRPSPSQVHTSTYGMAYGRATLGLRVAGICPRRIADMVARALRIEEEFAQGILRYDRKDFNCADVVAQILQTGGYCGGTLLKRLGLPTMPLDVFERARATFENDGSLRVELVAYRQVPGSQASCRFSRFPLSISRPLRSVARVLDDTPRDPLEAAVKKQVTAYFGDQRLYVESLQARRTASGLDDPVLLAHAQLNPENAIAADLRRLLAPTAKWTLREIARLGDSGAAREIRQLIDHSHDLARLPTKRAEEALLYSHARRLRKRFTQLVVDSGRIGPRRLTVHQVEAYMDPLQTSAITTAEEHDAPVGADVVGRRSAPRRTIPPQKFNFSIGTRSAQSTGAIEVSALKDSARKHCCLAFSVLVGMLLTGCAELRTRMDSVATPHVVTDDTQSAPGWVVERLARLAPDLYFDLSAHGLRERDREELSRITPQLQELLHDFPDLVIVVESYCDDRGSADYNLQLGRQRADAVRQALVSFGFPAGRLRSVSLGDKRPRCFTQDEACRQKNRRARLRATQLKLAAGSSG
ncbi:MAG: OmpA family protein, partial [Acidobacteriales bacterium]|nr:OmpA family protein [Terriglobales bacterium]